MKTIAISIDAPTLAAVDRLARQEAQPQQGRRAAGRSGNRSEVIREALQEFLARREKATREERERRILSANRESLARQAAALVREQAKP